MRILHLILALPLCAAAVSAQDKPKDAPRSGILVVNMFRAIEECDEGRAVVSRLKEERVKETQRYADEMQKLQEKVKELREKKTQDHDLAYYKELEQAMSTYARLEMEKNLFAVKKGDELARALQQLLLGAQEQAREEMQARGAEIVLLSKMGPVDIATENDFQQELLMRRAICADPSIDITDAVIARMNKWYAENRNATGVPKREEPPAKGATGGAEKSKDPARSQ